MCIEKGPEVEPKPCLKSQSPWGYDSQLGSPRNETRKEAREQRGTRNKSALLISSRRWRKLTRKWESSGSFPPCTSRLHSHPLPQGYSEGGEATIASFNWFPTNLGVWKVALVCIQGSFASGGKYHSKARIIPNDPPAQSPTIVAKAIGILVSA